MNIKIINKDESSLLSRTNISAEISIEGAIPSKADIKKELASSLKVDESLVVIKKVNSLFGAEKAVVNACAYDSVENLKRVEGEPQKSDKPDEQEQSAEKPAEQPKPEKPEEKPEEKSEEKKE